MDLTGAYMQKVATIYDNLPEQNDFFIFILLVMKFKCIQEPVAVTTAIQEEIFMEMGVGE